MDIKATVKQDELGFVVDAFIGDKGDHFTVMHPELEKALEAVSAYVLRVWKESEKD